MGYSVIDQCVIVTREDPMNLDPDIEAAIYERDGGRCFITGRTAGVRPMYIIPPSILEDKDLQPEVCLHILHILNVG